MPFKSYVGFDRTDATEGVTGFGATTPLGDTGCETGWAVLINDEPPDQKVM
jgi:hypothetical protein